jgi:hypothetical protein
MPDRYYDRGEKPVGTRRVGANWTPVHSSHIVVDTIDGYTFRSDADGHLFTRDSAHAFADRRNSEMKPQFQSYRVYRLTLDRPDQPGVISIPDFPTQVEIEAGIHDDAVTNEAYFAKLANLRRQRFFDAIEANSDI